MAEVMEYELWQTFERRRAGVSMQDKGKGRFDRSLIVVGTVIVLFGVILAMFYTIGEKTDYRLSIVGLLVALIGVVIVMLPFERKEYVNPVAVSGVAGGVFMIIMGMIFLGDMNVYRDASMLGKLSITAIPVIGVLLSMFSLLQLIETKHGKNTSSVRQVK